MHFQAVQSPKDLPGRRRILSDMPAGKSSTAALRDGYVPFSQAQRTVAVLVECHDNSLALIAAHGHEHEEVSNLINVIMSRKADRVLRCYMVPPGYIAAIYEQRIEQYAFDHTEAVVWTRIHELLGRAVDQKASDVLLFACGTICQVHLMIHQSKVHVDDLPAELGMEIARALYRQAPPDAQQRNFVGTEPQETSLEVVVHNAPLRLRYQHQPVDGGGVDVCLRLLRVNSDVSVDLLGLGFTPAQIDVLRPIILHPESMIIMNGPTGSGKSRTLATMLDVYDVYHEGRKHIRECSNPVEYPSLSVRQTNIVTQSGATSEEHKQEFVKQLRALMRMHPQAVLLGEIRDDESALFAMEMALTGHKLFTSTHARTPFEVYDRIRRWTKNEPSFYRDGFIGAIIGQRLLPTVCDHCAIELNDAPLSRYEALKVAFQRYAPQHAQHVRVAGPGCAACKLGVPGTGGKTVVAQILVPTPAINDALEEGQQRKAIQIWRTADGVPLGGQGFMQHAMFHILAGRMDPDLVTRQLGEDVALYVREQIPHIRSVS
jgi:general secretion pathway protein E